MANAVEKSCSMLVSNDKPGSPSEIKEALEGNDPVAKVTAMKQAVGLLLSGEQLPQLFITIVRYVLPSEDHTVQKLLLLYLVRHAGRWACRAGRAGARMRACACAHVHARTPCPCMCPTPHRRRPLRRRTRQGSCCQRWCVAGAPSAAA